mmetsp:Transcript_30197/g.81144  ORF Transcript_30197/g.81144 Transcript_30197/m.81144 type:complete len:720 (-) Transcript_30197:137-2296(-)
MLARARALAGLRGVGRGLSTAPKRPIKKLMAANRGEIAIRIFRAATELNIKTVAIFSREDLNSVHRYKADEGYMVGKGKSPVGAYLGYEEIVEVALKHGVDAIHPGYGFLSENAGFAQACADQGIEFIGPSPHAINAMGDKIQSKLIAKDADVYTIPGFIGVLETQEDILRIANEIGYPVMIKASAGGGGKGMRIAYSDQEAIEGFRMSRDEALASFGDDRLFVEKFIEEPRHIEIQLIADKHGNVVYLPERECSIQRRNQKVLEEAPSPFITPEVRKAMGEQAVALAKQVGYHSAGTVEFLVDKHRQHYFLEMNTRLQVEHPVTELISGVDLVEQMIRVANGEPLSMRQEDVTINGWALESRVYAEDPLRGFLPSTGRLMRYSEPTTDAVRSALAESDPEAATGIVRVDSGVREWAEISMHYDPMISKLVTHGPTRAASIALMRAALDRYVIDGLAHNVNFLREMMDHPRFLSGKIDTKLIEVEFKDGYTGYAPSEAQARDLAAVAGAIQWKSTAIAMGVRGAALTKVPLVLQVVGGTHEVTVAPGASPESVTVSSAVGGWERTLDVRSWGLGATSIFEALVSSSDSVPGATREPVAVQVIDRKLLGAKLQYCGSKFDVTVLTPAQAALAHYMPEKASDNMANCLVSPMPGILLSLAVKEGEKVVMGQELAVVEAMKMQNILRAPCDAVVGALAKSPGDTLAVDEVILEFEMEEAAAA